MSERLLLAADVGNTRIKFAFLKLPSVAVAAPVLPECLKSWIVPQTAAIDWPALAAQADSTGLNVSQCLLAGSQQERIEELAETWPTDWPAPRVIRSAVELPITLKVDQPGKVGVDRVLNAVAINRIRNRQTPAIIVDSGTAITIDAVTHEGEFAGGAILPGYELEAQALHHYTSLLPLIPMAEIIGQTPDIIGRNTHAALRSGLIWGQVGAVNEIVSRMAVSLEAEAGSPPLFSLTGGAAPLLEPHLREHFRVYPQLTIQGLGCL